MSPTPGKVLFLGTLGVLSVNTLGHAAATKTEIVKKGDAYQLLRNGQPFFIKGAGGDGNKPQLKALGANSFRTWGSDNLEGQLDEAAKLGLTVTVGIWLGHKEHGFNYSDAQQVKDQFERAKAAINRYKDHPAVLMWGIGNEMEGYQGTTDPKMWAAVEEIAAYAKQVDKNHPTMTVIAEIGGDRVKSIHQYCPSIDVIGINSYGGGPSIPERYRKEGGTKPYALTEFGPPGTWELPKNDWGAVHEPTSTEKANSYRATYEKAVLNQPLSVGSYAFTWGNKQEATATWYGLLLPDGSKLNAVDTLSELWSGKKPENLAPQIQSLKLEGPGKITPGATVRATLSTADAEKAPLKVKWVLQHDPLILNTGGATEAEPATFPDAIVKADNASVEIKMPSYGGGYRIFAYVYDNAQGAAVANVPLFIEGGDKAPPAPARRAKLPLTVFGDDGEKSPYVPSGYMGNYGAIKMNAESQENPRSGKNVLKVEYTQPNNWGGVVWQSPANDWGDQAGGLNLTGAKKLTFWARGENGGENITFGYGLIGNDKPFPDSGKGKTQALLTKEWKQFEIDVTGETLTRIKSGFYWTLGAHGAPITFYLDDIRFE